MWVVNSSRAFFLVLLGWLKKRESSKCYELTYSRSARLRHKSDEMFKNSRVAYTHKNQKLFYQNTLNCTLTNFFMYFFKHFIVLNLFKHLKSQELVFQTSET